MQGKARSLALHKAAPVLCHQRSLDVLAETAKSSPAQPSLLMSCLRAGDGNTGSRVPATSQPEQPEKAPPEPGATAPASGPSEQDLRDYSASGLVRVRLKDAAMAAQQSSPQVRLS